LIERDLGQCADQRLAELEQAGEEGLVVWDESVIEKPESIVKDRLVFGAIEQGAPTRAHQTRLLQSAREVSHFRAGHELAGSPVAGTQRSSGAGSDAASGRRVGFSLVPSATKRNMYSSSVQEPGDGACCICLTGARLPVRG
jgi:hypothetical protein